MLALSVTQVVVTACAGVGLAAAYGPGTAPLEWMTMAVPTAPMFELLCVFAVADAGPWLLIAWYAWRKPTRPMPDDGSPYPRRYCSACGYNLHGLNGGRCPECGAEPHP